MVTTFLRAGVEKIGAGLFYLMKYFVVQRFRACAMRARGRRKLTARIVEFAQILYGHFGRDENTEANTVVNHRNVHFRCRIELTVEVLG